MSERVKQLALEFNRVSPPPPAPRDETVYENEPAYQFPDFQVSPPAPESGLPACVDTVLPLKSCIATFRRREPGRMIRESLAMLATGEGAPSAEIIKSLEREQIRALSNAVRNGEAHGYKIFDPFHPLEDLASPATQAFIDAQNERTKAFTDGTRAWAKAGAFLRDAWRGRVCAPFTVSDDRGMCMKHRHLDHWKYPWDGYRTPTDLKIGRKEFVRRTLSADMETIETVSGEDGKHWKKLITGGPGNLLRGTFVYKNRLVASFYHNCTDELKIFDVDGRHLADVPLPVGKIKEARIDRATGDLHLRIASFTRPEADYIYDDENNRLMPQDETPGPLDDCIVEQIWAPANGGVRVPMWIARRPDTALDGTAALKIFAYGAAGIPKFPQYSESMAQWVRAGGIYVLANLRGGNELGENWAEQGNGMNRQNVVDDLVACARELRDCGYTVPKRTVIEGGSNGGWLMLETVVQNKFPFGAAISHVPVSDLYRCKTDGGAYPPSWSNEGFPARMKLSPYHRVTPSATYTPTMILAGDCDTIANPWHALKMTAALQSASSANLCLLRVRRGTGHRAEFITNGELIAEEAAIHAFIENVIGPVDQNEYKTSIAAPTAKAFQPS